MFETNNFKFTETSIKDVYIIEPKKFKDERGYFMETYKKEDFELVGLNYDFIQDNESESKYGVLRGLHFQKAHPQAKLVRCVEGEVFDVCVDLRPNSKTYGKYVSVVLSAKKGNQLLIPKGFAHGYLVLSKKAKFCYKCDEKYYPKDCYTIRYDDPTINIEWPEVDNLILANKDINCFYLVGYNLFCAY